MLNRLQSRIPQIATSHVQWLKEPVKEGCSCWQPPFTPLSRGLIIPSEMPGTRKTVYSELWTSRHHESNLTWKPPQGTSQASLPNWLIHCDGGQRSPNTCPWISVFVQSPNPRFSVPPSRASSFYPVPPSGQPLHGPTVLLTPGLHQAFTTVPFGDGLTSGLHRLAPCCPSLVINLLLVGFLPVLCKLHYVSEVQLLQRTKCYRRHPSVLKWPDFTWFIIYFS